MKAIPRPALKNTKEAQLAKRRIIMDIDTIIQTKKATMAHRILAFMILTLYKEFDFDEKELQRFYKAFEDELVFQGENLEDADDEILYRELDRIGMSKLVKMIKNDYAAEVEARRGTVFADDV